MGTWHYLDGGVTRGPLREEELRALLERGTIGPDTLVWTQGMEQWSRLVNCTPLQSATAIPASATVAVEASPQVAPTPGEAGTAAAPRHPSSAPAPTAADRPSSSAAEASSPSPAPGESPRDASTPPPASGGRLVDNLSERIGRMASTETVRMEHVGGLFSEVFRRHDERALEEVFAAGLRSTTPALEQIDASHPTPWVFSRVLAFFGVAFLALWFGWSEYANLNLVPGIILIGSFAFPLGTAIFFFECNVARNVPLFVVSKMFIWGGILGILLSLVGFETTAALGSKIGPPIAAIVEEPGKLAAVLLLVNAQRFPWTLNGLALGAAVGAGFAAFESAGYALTFLALSSSDDVMLSVIVQRGLLAPFAHVVWTAVAAGALWRVRAGRAFEWEMLRERRFLAPMLLVMALHAIWNSPLPAKLPFQLGFLLLGAVGWTIAIGLLLGGLREIQNMQRRS
jgi:RsiW-degrading membrane proteinase PrsW (M82 family)